VVIVGGGFAGMSAARALARAPVDVVVLDRTNHHVFQPLLYQVATAVLTSNDVTSPIRRLLKRQQNTTVLLADVREIDPEARIVRIDDNLRELHYDYLILVPGARHSYFGNDEWETHAPGLKTIADAQEIRRRFLLAFEEAEKTDSEEERDAFLTFVVVGGGPTGVELAGMIPAVARQALPKEFRRVDTRRAKVFLVEALPRILPTFSEDLAARAERDLKELGVEVRTNTKVTGLEHGIVKLADGEIRSRAIFWAAGNAASPLGAFLNAPRDKAGRVKVNSDLSVPGHPEIFVAGDLAQIEQPDGTPVPAVAPAANQQGTHVARNILRDLRKTDRLPFRYRDRGSLATIGRHRAVAEFGRFRLTGWIAWWFWLLLHVLYLTGFRNRISVLLEWGYAYFTNQRGARLITERDYPDPASPLHGREEPVRPKW
jgi:NADH:ubiquinone reductase (H+-translocating)